MTSGADTNERAAIAPALTAEEWGKYEGGRYWDICRELVPDPDDWRDPTRGREVRAHALAALCLYDRPFGFTRLDVARLRGLAASYRRVVIGGPWPQVKRAREAYSELSAQLTDLANRIEALLPPPTITVIGEIVTDPSMPPDEVHAYQDGRHVATIQLTDKPLPP